MKQTDEMFLALYDEYDTESMEKGEKDKMTECYQNVLCKAGLGSRAKKRGFKLLLAAAITAATALTAAAVYGASVS